MQRYNYFYYVNQLFLHDSKSLTMKRMKIAWCGLILMALLLVACGNDKPDYKKKLEVVTGQAPELVFDRYEEALFNADTAHFQQELMAVQQKYMPFLGGDLTNPDAIRYLKDFAVDTLSIRFYRKVKETYPDLKDVAEIIETEYRYFNHYYPEIQLPKHVYTCVSGVDPEIPPVLFLDDCLVISLDWYLNGDEIYDRIGMPRYRSERTASICLAKDLGLQLYQNYVRQGHKQSNLLEEMVDVGKQDYFIEAMYPSISDATLLGYTTDQMQWAENNEGNLWADMVGNQYLYSTELEMYRTFLADGPFTNEYSHEAPARLGEFLGLHIVRSYMGSHDVALQDLMKNNDLQEIFQESGYKPKK